MSTDATDISNGENTNDGSPSADPDDIPMMQWLYNRIFLVAIASLVFFFVVYLGWGLVDILSVPSR